MAFAFTDLNKLNIDALSDVISLTLNEDEALQRNITVMSGIEKGTPVVTFKAEDKAVRRSSGCDSEYKYSSTVDSVKYYDHAQIELPIVVCLQDLWGKMVAKGVHLSDDFDQTTLAAFMQNEILRVLAADMLRLSWLDGLKTLDTDGEYTVFKNGGIIKQARASTINIKTVKPGDTGDILTKMKACIDDQRSDIRSKCEFFVTSNIMRAYKNLLQSKDNTTAQMILEDGRPAYFLEGYRINEMEHVSASAKNDALTTQTIIAFTPKDNIQLALEDANLSISPFIRDAKDRKYYSTTIFAADAMLAVPDYLQLAVAATA
jgi:hypothetical protein